MQGTTIEISEETCLIMERDFYQAYLECIRNTPWTRQNQMKKKAAGYKKLLDHLFRSRTAQNNPNR